MNSKKIPIWRSQRFEVSQMTQGWRPDIGGCLVIECANKDIKLEIWYSPNGDTPEARGWVEIEAAVPEVTA